MERTPEITMDSDAGLVLLLLAVRGVPMHYTELAARMWPDERNVRERAAAGVLLPRALNAIYSRREAWAAQAVNKLIVAGLAEADPDLGGSWARVTVAGSELARTWVVMS